MVSNGVLTRVVRFLCAGMLRSVLDTAEVGASSGDDICREEAWKHPQQRAERSRPLVLEPPTNAEGIELEIQGDSKTVVDWINGHAKQRTTVDAVRAARKETTGGAEAPIYEEELMPGRYTFFGNMVQKLTPGWKREVRGRQEEWKG